MEYNNMKLLASVWQDYVVRYFTEGNVILIIIAGCSLLAMTIFLERLLYLRKSEINTNAFIINLRKAIQEHNIIDAIRICEDTGGSLANIIKVALLRHNYPKDEIEAGVEIAGLN